MIKDDIQKAIEIVSQNFPFKGYMNPSQKAYFNIGKTVLNYLKPGADILDFGAGPCDKTAILSVLGFNCSACDDLKDSWHVVNGNRQKILNFARRFGIDFRLIEQGKESFFEKEKFDMLIMNDVLEHLHNSPRDLVNNLLELVKPQGYFFATVPNAVNLKKRIQVIFGKTNLPSFDCYYWYPGSWRGHIREYTKNDLIKLAQYLNLDILELRGCHQMLPNEPSLLRSIWVILTGIFRGGCDSWLIVAKKRPNWTPKKSLPQKELKAILSRYTYT